MHRQSFTGPTALIGPGTPGSLTLTSPILHKRPSALSPRLHETPTQQSLCLCDLCNDHVCGCTIVSYK